MQTCPNCGSEARNGAKFCTSCGYRFDENGEPGTQVEAVASIDLDSNWSTRPFAADNDRPVEGWPSVPADPRIEESDWRQTTARESETEPAASTTSGDEAAGFWPESAPESWPAAPSQLESSQRGPVPTVESSLDEPAEPKNHAAEWHDRSETRILELVDQLRAAIEANPAIGSFDLSGVISDLEVAVTVPGAVPPDELAELRDALFAARENPRDVDTIVDLTKRIDGLVSLVISYDRALAAIERSLAVMKQFQPPEPSVTEADIASGESSG